MSVAIISGDIVRKNQVESILIEEYGLNDNIKTFLNAIFGSKKEIIFNKFVTSFFQSTCLNQLSQKKLFSILSDNSPPNETLKRAAKNYKERYSD